MLCLDRKHGDSVVVRVNEPCEITVTVSIRRGKVRLGFEAPRHVRILRGELLQDASGDEQCSRKSN